MTTKNIRNFSIIAHIDHGKSTLADRFLQYCQALSDREMMNQVLDDMDLERERGITIKARAVSLKYQSQAGKSYVLNLIDTPGHVDFSFEVSRSLSACEGVLLLVDASQGIQAQTMANMHLAREKGLVIIGVINKIDLPNADPEGCRQQLIQQIGLDDECIFESSAKTGSGIVDILEAVVKFIPPPGKVSESDKLKALVFDSNFDNYRGVIAYVRIFSDSLKVGEKITFMVTGGSYEVLECGVFTPAAETRKSLTRGMVGYVVAGVRNPEEVKVGDTLTRAKDAAKEPLQQFQQSQPVVFSGVYPIDPADYEGLKQAMEKLRLNDSSLSIEAETSIALGFGFRVGFLGLLHMEIFQERLDREYDIAIIMTTPSVIYQVMDRHGHIHPVDNPAVFPDPAGIEGVDEPYVKIHIVSPSGYMGGIMHLCQEKRGLLLATESLVMDRVLLSYRIPLAEILTDYYDKLKSITQGYGSMDYDEDDYRPADVVKLDVLLNGEMVDAFSTIVHRSKAETVGRSLISKLKEVIPRHMFTIPIQATIGGKVIARETIKALRKNVTAKCYGGDITRKKKLLEKQKAGKKKMKQIGKVNVPKNAFMEVLKNG